MLEIVKASGLATIQDLGWEVGRAIGLPRSGAMDRASLRLANALVGNQDDHAGIELALGPFSARFDDDRSFAFTGGLTGQLDGVAVPNDTTNLARAGQRLELRPTARPRFGYLALAGGIAIPPTLGSRSTYLPTGIGGHQGRRLATGDRLPLGLATAAPPPGFSLGGIMEEPGPIRVIPGPQAHLFAAEALGRLGSEPFVISPTSDRMGTRLKGPPLTPLVKATLPSEATCIGAVQVPDDGQPIVLLADGPTVGGYSKLAALITADLDRFVRMGPGESVRFRVVSIADAELALRAATAAFDGRLATIRGAIPR